MGFSNVGKWIYLIAINLKILAHTNSPYAIAILYIIAPAAKLLTNLWSGSIIDVYNKKFILVSVDIIRCILVFCIFMTDNVILIYILTFIMGVVASFFIPTSNIFIVNNVEQRERKKFNSIMSTVNSGAMLVGPAIAGIIISTYNIDITIFITSILFLVCAICIFCIPNSEKKRQNGQVKSHGNFIVKDLKYVISFFQGNKNLLTIFILFYGFALIGFALDSQEATYIKMVLESDSKSYGYLMTVAGIGSISSTYTANMFSVRTYIGLGGLLGSLGYTFFYISPNEILAGLSFFLLGFCLTYAFSGFTTFFQNNIPEEKMGRVGSISEFFQGIIQIILTLLIGYLAEVFTLQSISVIFALASVFIAIGLYGFLGKNSKSSESSLDLN